MVQSYDALAGLDHLYLEDSYVLDISSTGTELRFRMEFVLTEDHPAYTPPPPGEMYCYRSGWLRFTDVRHLELSRSGTANTDATGEVDLGNIDAFWFEDDSYELEGDWGTACVVGGDCVVVLDELS